MDERGIGRLFHVLSSFFQILGVVVAILGLALAIKLAIEPSQRELLIEAFRGIESPTQTPRIVTIQAEVVITTTPQPSNTPQVIIEEVTRLVEVTQEILATSLPLEVTETPSQTDTPAPIITPTPIVNLLEVHEIYNEGGMKAEIGNVTFAPKCSNLLGVGILITNESGGELVVDVTGDDITITDNLGQTYREIKHNLGAFRVNCYYYYPLDTLDVRTLGSGNTIDLWMQVSGILSSDITHFYVSLHNAGRITDVTWKIDVPR